MFVCPAFLLRDATKYNGGSVVGFRFAKCLRDHIENFLLILKLENFEPKNPKNI